MHLSRENFNLIKNCTEKLLRLMFEIKKNYNEIVLKNRIISVFLNNIKRA